ncbi:hypothetical protein ACFWH1_18725 [Streptomyces sp. NPDC127037]|uniref:hypothetical protein n=1 Tax=Streptomyces sp. NPDC127037 TaxID=3347113 RepID=UPI003648AEA9
MPFQTEDELRRFLRLCLDPGPGRPTRSPETLARVLPAWMADDLAQHAPALAALRAELARAEAAVTAARARFAEGLKVWIAQETSTDEAPAEQPSPPQSATQPRGECPACGLVYAMSRRGVLGFHHGMTPSGFSTGSRCDGVGLPPYQAVGA